MGKHLALLAGASLVTAEPGERRRCRWRSSFWPRWRDWDGPLGG